MSVEVAEFDSFFQAIYGYAPFPWQSRLSKRVHDAGWPGCIDLPTASGKTSAIDVAVFVLACQAARPTNERTVGRRIFFAVNRRVIVDEAHDRALKLAKKLLEAKESGIVKRVADALRELNGDRDAPPLDVAELRGGIYRDRRWARGITQPIVVATTADQLGSRLLFRGYGVSRGMQPIHAALTACDSLLLLDEAHVTRAFAQTLQALSQYRRLEKATPPMHFVQMTATPTGGIPPDQRFTLDEADRAHPQLFKRQNASKPAELVNLGRTKAGQFVDTFADRAINSLSDARKAIGVIVNRVQTARDVRAAIREQLASKNIDADVHLVIGRMRPIDRDKLTNELRAIVGPDRQSDALPRPCFVVATQCLEVGADYDFDALITECASIDALRQRFGRLNRKGRSVEARAEILTTEAAMKEDDPVYGVALRNTWEWLTADGRKSVDFGILAFEPLWKTIEAEVERYLDPRKPTSLFAPAPDAAVLLPAHLDALCQTAPYPIPSPDVSYFIHGPQRDETEVQVCWRADLGTDPSYWKEIVSMVPPSSPECMPVPIRALRNWMQPSSAPLADADVAVRAEEVGSLTENSPTQLLIWRGAADDRTGPTQKLSDIRPGDTVVIPVSVGGWEALGHIPGAPDEQLPGDPAQRAAWERIAASIDMAEEAAAIMRRRVLRVHTAFGREPLLKLLADESISTRDRSDAIRASLSLHEGISLRRDELLYPDGSGVVLRFKQLIPSVDGLAPPGIEDDDDSLLDIGTPISLAAHTADVLDFINKSLPYLQQNSIDACQRRAAELHDLGKADLRFQAMLLGSTPEEAILRRSLLGKSGKQNLSIVERRRQRERSRLPDGFRHEMLSMQIIEHCWGDLVDPSIDADLLLHLVAAHHGHGRPFAPVAMDCGQTEETLAIAVEGLSISAKARRQLTPSHRLDSGVADRFWRLTRHHGWWGLAYLESILRLADQQASEAEQNEEKSR